MRTVDGASWKEEGQIGTADDQYAGADLSIAAVVSCDGHQSSTDQWNNPCAATSRRQAKLNNIVL
jgi:hypothetical protein